MSNVFWIVIIFGAMLIGSCGVGKNGRCTLGPNQSLELRGLRMGMNMKEIPERYKVEYDDGIFEIPNYKIGSVPEMKGVESATFDSRGGQLTRIRLVYETTEDSSSEFENRFYASVLASLGIDAVWGAEVENKRTVVCGPYQIVAELDPEVNTRLKPGTPGWFKYTPSVTIDDVETKRIWAEAFENKQREEIEKKSKEFKP